MKYRAMQDVVINGTAYAEGQEIELHGQNVARLIMLGYLVEELKPVTNRATKPKRKRNGS